MRKINFNDHEDEIFISAKNGSTINEPKIIIERPS
jgi:hypothetical protein